MQRNVNHVLVAALMAWASAYAGPPDGAEAPDMAKMIAAAKGAADNGGDEKPAFPPFEEVTKGMESQKGLFTLWYHPAGAKDKDTENLLCQIPAAFLGEKFMLSTSVAGGGFFTGFPLDERVVQWEQLEKQLLLIEPETHYVANEGETVADVVKRTYPERIRAAIPIVTKSPSGDPVIDLGRLLKSNFADIGWMSAGPFGGFGGSAGINSSLSKWTTKKAFELNVEIGVELAMARSSPPGSYDKKMVHYSFWKLPKTDYQPRVADDRVGYFLTAQQDWAKPVESRDLFNRYIDRWHLQKRDPGLALCEPKQPIVFYIEKTVPVRFRRAVRDGILEWNEAFEKVGFVNAVEVRQQTDDNEWADLDPEDMRYSFFRWIVTGASFAMGPHRANPFSGQIYDADIVFDDSMVRSFERSADRLLPATAMDLKFQDPVVRAFVEKYPQWKRPTRDWERFVFGGDRHDGETLREAMRERMQQRGYFGCAYAEGMKHQLALGGAVLGDKPDEVKERFLYEVIKEVVMHEVGHTLGLRHNFKASSIYSVEEIQRRRGTGEPTVGSVMDYNPALFFSEHAREGHFITPTIGPYDVWAIEYGYRPADGSYQPPTTEEPPADPGAEKGADLAADKPESGPAADIPKDVLEKLPDEVKKLIAEHAAKAGNGNTSPPGKTPSPAMFKGPASGEEKMLEAIASRATEPELAYSTDEDTTMYGPDPRSNRFDMGADPVDWARKRVELVNQRMENILDWAVKEDEAWYYLRSAFQTLMFEKVRVLEFVGNYVGGQYTNRAHRGDPNAEPPFVPVDVETQRKALDFIEESLYSDEFFSVSPKLLNHLAAPRWWHQGTEIDFMVDYPIHDLIGALQWYNLFDRLFPNTLRRMHDAEMKVAGDDRLLVAEYVQRLQKAVWADAVSKSRLTGGSWSDSSPFISSIRRSLQREYLNLVEPLVRVRPGLLLSPDLHAMVQYSLQNLSEEIGKMLDAGGMDFASRAHLSACQSRITRMLAPELDEYGGL
jgi:hypothetical protein